MSIKCIPHPKFPVQIISRIYTGTVEVNEILESWKSIIDTKMITSSTSGILQHLGDAEINISIQDFEHVMKYLDSQNEFRSVKIATVTYSPNSIVFPMLSERFYPNLTIKPFSTEKAALDWLLK